MSEYLLKIELLKLYGFAGKPGDPLASMIIFTRVCIPRKVENR